MGVEGGGEVGGVEGGGEGEEEEEQGLPGQQEQHGTPGGVIDRLVGHMTVPRLPVLVEAGSTTNTTTAANNNNDNTANTIDIMHIRLLHRRQKWKQPALLAVQGKRESLVWPWQGLRWQGGRGLAGGFREAEAGCGGRCWFFSRPLPPTRVTV